MHKSTLKLPIALLTFALSTQLFAQGIEVNKTVGFNSNTKKPYKGFKNLKDFVIGLEELSPNRFKTKASLTSVSKLKSFQKQIAIIDYDFFAQYNSKFNLMPKIGVNFDPHYWDLKPPQTDYFVSYTGRYVKPFENIVDFYQALTSQEIDLKGFIARIKITPKESLNIYGKIIQARKPILLFSMQLRLQAWQEAGFKANPNITQLINLPKSVELGFEVPGKFKQDPLKGFQSLEEFRSLLILDDISIDHLSLIKFKYTHTLQRRFSLHG